MTTTGVARATALDGDPGAEYDLGGEFGRRVASTIEAWLLTAPGANPDMLEMFRRRNRRPLQLVAPWAGEYAGKFLTHAALIYALTRDERLRRLLDWFVREIGTTQSPDGYLGPFPDDDRLRPGGGPVIELQPPEWVWPTPWDAWGNYHVLLGLLTWHRWTGDERALVAARAGGEFFARYVLDEGHRLSALGAIEMNQAPVHAAALLHGLTGDPRQLALAEAIVEDFAANGAGDYLRAGVRGVPFHETPKPRWESLHAIEALAELGALTGSAAYRSAAISLWQSIARHDRHPNGGFGSNERASGDPYAGGPLETCCTVAWLALSIDVLRLTGDSLAADELELATLNAGFGALSRSGRWVTYDTPLDGERRAFAVDNPWQARVGAPELSCCATNGPRVLGLVADWAVMVGRDGLALNWFGPGSVTVTLRDGRRVTVRQVTDYPLDGRIRIVIEPDRRGRFAVDLRIPRWSRQTSLSVAGSALEAPVPGRYYRVERDWGDADELVLDLDLDLHVWARPTVPDTDGSLPATLFRGPLLLAYDPRLDTADRTTELRFDASTLVALPREPTTTWLAPWLLVNVPDAEGRSVPLVDFASAGQGGDRYRSWLPIRGLSDRSAPVDPAFPSRPMRAPADGPPR